MCIYPYPYPYPYLYVYIYMMSHPSAEVEQRVTLDMTGFRPLIFPSSSSLLLSSLELSDRQVYEP